MSTPSPMLQLPTGEKGRKEALCWIRGHLEAERVASPHALAAETMGKIFGANPDALAANMIESAKAVHGGSLVGVETTLAAQAITLNALFNRLTQVATEKPRPAEEFATYFKLALRAQAQSAKALEVLGNLKQGPRVVITGQLNAANQQVVNNGPQLPKPAKGRDSATASDSRPRRRGLSQRSTRDPDLIAAPPQPTKQYATLD